MSVRQSGPNFYFSVTNDNPVAAFLKHGTRFMFARPIEEAVEAEAEPRIIAALEEELERLFSNPYG